MTGGRRREMRGESVMVLLVGGHRLTGQVVALAEEGSSDDLWIDRAMQEITLETSVTPDDTDRRTLWRYRIPASAIVWVAYPAPPDPEGSPKEAPHGGG
jgi:hypothetical protein